MRQPHQSLGVLLAALAVCCCLAGGVQADLIINSGTTQNPYIINSAQDLSQTASPYFFRVGTTGSAVASIESGGSVYNSAAGGGTKIGTGSSGDGVLVVDGGTLYSTGARRTVAIGEAGGLGGLIIDSGAVAATTVTLGIGGSVGADSYGEVEITGGTLDLSSTLYLGKLAGGYVGSGTVTQTGGTITLAGAVRIGYAGGTDTSTLEISGGVLNQSGSSADVYVGTSSSDGVLHVNGSGATSITIADRIYGNADHTTLKFTVDSGGVTPISVNYTYSYLNGTVDMELAQGVTPSTNQTFDLIITRTGTLTSSLTLAAGDGELWELQVVNDDTLQAKYLGVAEVAPVADAGEDQNVIDTDDSGAETVTLDGSGSYDTDGSIASWVWKEGPTQVATGETPQVSFSVGVHTIVLTVTDDDDLTDTDTVVITVSEISDPPVADAGSDQVAEDADDNGSHSVTLNGTGSTDDVAITSYVWKDAGGAQIATGATPNVTLDVGINDITLVVTDGENQTDTAVVRVWIYPDVDYWVDRNHPSASNGNNGTSPSTPWLTIDYAVDHVSAGDVILVREGVYRERVSLGTSGTVSSPITLMGYPGERVVVSGADEISGWTQCTLQIAKDNPNYASIYYADIAWKPTRLVQDGNDLLRGREPDSGWYVCTGGSTTTLVDANNLGDSNDMYNGAIVFLSDKSSGTVRDRDIADYVAATSTLTLTSTWTAPEANTDLYYLSNRVEMISDSGQWAVEDIGGGSYRVYCWADGGGDPDGYELEGSRITYYCLGLGSRSYWVIDNLEMRHSLGYGIGTTNSGGGHNIIRNCSIHHNDAYGIRAVANHYTEIRSNFVGYNENGINTNSSSDILVENNEVCHNLIDGVVLSGPGGASWANNVTLRNNSIHHQAYWNHPDGCQSVFNLRDMVIEGNLVLCSGQMYMFEDCEDTIIRNNIFVGAFAAGLILGGSSTFDTTLENNTVGYARYSLLQWSTACDGYDLSNNIFVQGHDDSRNAGGMTSSHDWTSNYNLWWHGPDLSHDIITWNSTQCTLSEYQTASGEDADSLYVDPKFVNAPAYLVGLDMDEQANFTSTRVYVDDTDLAALFDVGDYVELDFDGVVRTVTSVGGYYIEFSPACPAVLSKVTMLANWLDNNDFALDLSLDTGSPAIGAGSSGGDMGSSIDVQAYLAGDFNGDGRRDIPAWGDGPPVESGNKLVGDTDGDGDVDLDDFVALKANFGSTNATWADGDFTKDGTVDLDDFVILKANFGMTAE